MAQIHTLTVEPMTEDSFKPFGEVWSAPEIDKSMELVINLVLSSTDAELIKKALAAVSYTHLTLPTILLV